MSLRIISAILSQECITVEWSRPENTRPMAVVESGVSSRIRYMLTCRGRAMSRLRRLPVTSSLLTE